MYKWGYFLMQRKSDILYGNPNTNQRICKQKNAEKWYWSERSKTSQHIANTICVVQSGWISLKE